MKVLFSLGLVYAITCYVSAQRNPFAPGPLLPDLRSPQLNSGQGQRPQQPPQGQLQNQQQPQSQQQAKPQVQTRQAAPPFFPDLTQALLLGNDVMQEMAAFQILNGGRAGGGGGGGGFGNKMFNLPLPYLYKQMDIPLEALYFQ